MPCNKANNYADAAAENEENDARIIWLIALCLIVIIIAAHIATISTAVVVVNVGWTVTSIAAVAWTAVWSAAARSAAATSTEFSLKEGPWQADWVNVVWNG